MFVQGHFIHDQSMKIENFHHEVCEDSIRVHTCTFATWHLAVWRLLRVYKNISKQAVRVVTQYASAPCKLTVSSHLFARRHLFWYVGYLRHQKKVDLW